MTTTDHPYFMFPLTEDLRHCSDPARRKQLIELLAANIGETDALANLIEDESLRNFYPDEAIPEADPIDSFIARFGAPGEPSDLADILQPKPRRKKESEPRPARPQASDPEMEEVKTLVKNREYRRALEIMEQIYLNNPKKSVYFADQIRFIRKLEQFQRK